MSRILHVVNYFDPALSVLRCFRELRKYSKHEHRLLTLHRHPLQHIYQYDEPERFADAMPHGEIGKLFEWCDGVLHHFVGWERGWHDPDKPMAFRNVNIYWDKSADRFWSSPVYNSGPTDKYRLLASSHVGARDFLGEPFRWLPDLVPLDFPYKADFSDRPPCVSYIKHHEALNRADFGSAKRLDLHDTAHTEVIRRRRTEATVVIDNCCDAHWGLAGQESMILGLPTICFNHAKTRYALGDLVRRGKSAWYPPFFEVGPSIEEAIDKAREILAWSPVHLFDVRHEIRMWVETFFDPCFLIEQYWDPFFQEFLSDQHSDDSVEKSGATRKHATVN